VVTPTANSVALVVTVRATAVAVDTEP